MYNDRKSRPSALVAQRNHPVPARRALENNEAPLFKKILLSSLIGAGVCGAVGILLVTVFSLVACKSPDPLSLIPTLSLLSLLPSSFLGGFVSAKRTGEAALPTGLVCAAMWSALSLALSVCLYSAPSSGYTLWQGLLLHLFSALFCVLGALAGGIKRKPSRKRRRFG